MHDGCSGGLSKVWVAISGEAPPFEGCCDTHDKAYAVGGTRAERRKANLALYNCVAYNGYPGWASVMWVAVRLFGGPFWPLPWRWGFEKPFGTGYFEELEKDKG